MATTLTKEKKGTGEVKPAAMTREPLVDTKLASWNRLREEFDELWTRLSNQVPALVAAEQTDPRWTLTVADEPETYIVRVEAPRFKISDFTVELRGQQLVLQARKTDRKNENEAESIATTEFYRAMTIPEYVVKDKIEATYRDGVLEVRMPKTAEAQTQKIEVRP